MSKKPHPFIAQNSAEDERHAFDHVLETLPGVRLEPHLTPKQRREARAAPHPWLPAKDARQQGRSAQVKLKERVRRRP